MLTQLNPVLPVTIKPNSGSPIPAGKGMAIMVQKFHPDHHLTWVIVMDETGEIWEVENPYVRFQANYTWGRNLSPQIRENRLPEHEL